MDLSQAYAIFGYTTDDDHEDEVIMCGWYSLCSNQADGHVDHPVLGSVPTCTRCAEMDDLDFADYEI